MALTAPARYTNRAGISLVGQNSYPVKNAITIWHGALVGVDTAGYLTKWSSGTAAVLLAFKGLAMPVGARSNDAKVVGDTAATPVPECPVNESGLILDGVSVTGATTQASVGDPVYATDENTFTMTATPNVSAIGTLVRWKSSGVGDVQLMTPEGYQALDALGKV